MEDIHDIKPIIEADPKGLIILTVIIISILAAIFGLYFLFYLDKRYREYLSRRIKKVFTIKINYKKVALDKLNILIKSVDQKATDDVFFELSAILRWYIECVFQNKALKRSKSELEYMNVLELNQILTKCYEVQFAKKSVEKSYAIENINSAIRLINSWN